MPSESFYLSHIKHYMAINKPVPSIIYQRLAEVRRHKFKENRNDRGS